MLNKFNLDIAALASKEASRFTLNGINVTSTETQVTDGHVLMTVTRPKLKAEGFPLIPGSTPVGTHAPFIMGTEDAKTISKRLPRKATIPILATAAICEVTNDRTGARTVPIATTDLETHETQQCRAVEGNFPDVARVTPDPRKMKHSICLNAAKLRALLAQFDKFTADNRNQPIRIYFTDATHALRIDADNGDQHMMGLIMPVRCDEWPERATPTAPAQQKAA